MRRLSSSSRPSDSSLRGGEHLLGVDVELAKNELSEEVVNVHGAEVGWHLKKKNIIIDLKPSFHIYLVIYSY